MKKRKKKNKTVVSGLCPYSHLDCVLQLWKDYNHACERNTPPKAAF